MKREINVKNRLKPDANDYSPDSEQFMSMFLKHQRGIYAFLRVAVGRHMDADDLVQEVAMRAWRNFYQYDSTRPFSAWLIGIARNVLRDYYKAQEKNNRLHLDSDTIAELATNAMAFNNQTSDYEEALAHCMSKLPAKDQKLVHKRFEPRATNRSVAADLHWSEAKMSRVMSRIYDLLHACIKSRLNEGAG